MTRASLPAGKAALGKQPCGEPVGWIAGALGDEWRGVSGWQCRTLGDRLELEQLLTLLALAASGERFRRRACGPAQDRQALPQCASRRRIVREECRLLLEDGGDRRSRRCA